MVCVGRLDMAPGDGRTVTLCPCGAPVPRTGKPGRPPKYCPACAPAHSHKARLSRPQWVPADGYGPNGRTPKQARIEARPFACTSCGALPEDDCLTADGVRCLLPHAARDRLAQQARALA